MRILLLVFFFSIYRINGHGQHANDHPASHSGQPHISRKMQDHVHDTNHIRHDLEGQINKSIAEMTPEEQNFYYFKLHDTNNDDRLDGLEVIAAFNHAHEEDNAENASTGGNNSTQATRFSDEELTTTIDNVMKEEDLNQDGFITYDEFKRALENDARQQK